MGEEGSWTGKSQGVVVDDVMAIRPWIAFRYWTLVLPPGGQSRLTSCSEPIRKWLPDRLCVPSSIQPEQPPARDRSPPML
jgi:hypothetical protein